MHILIVEDSHIIQLALKAIMENGAITMTWLLMAKRLLSMSGETMGNTTLA